MKYLISLLVFFGNVNPVWALTVSSRYSLNPVGSYYKEIVIQCPVGEEAYCQTLCQKDNECSRVEPYCLNCAGTTSLLLRTLFTQIAQIYKPSHFVYLPQELVRYLAYEKYILLGANSVYNFYRPINSPELLQSLMSFCPSGDEEALLAVSLDAENEPTKLDFVICRATDGSSKAYGVELSQPMIGEKPLQLKMKWNLRLR